MFNRFRYILFSGLLLLCSTILHAQDSTPDNICVGAVKHYYVDPNPLPGSTYTWWINGAVQTGKTTNEIDIEWTTTGIFELDVQELSVDGCLGPLRTLQVTVNELPSLVVSSIVQPTCSVPTGSVTLTGLPDGTWNINPGAISGTGSSKTISGLSPGTYNFTVTSEAGCTSGTPSDVVIDAQPVAPSPPAVSTNSLSNVCPSETVDIISIVTSSAPAGGFVHYKTSNDPSGVDVIDPAHVANGSYYIFYQNQEGCYSPGTLVTVTIVPCPPDVTPSLIVNPNIMHGITIFNLTVKVTELNMVNTNGLITVNIPKDSRWILTSGFVQSLTIIGTTPVNNSVWTYSSNATNHIFTTTSVIPSGGSLTFGFRVTFNPGSTRGIYTITSQLVSGSGGEIRVSNNADSEKIDYFQQ